MPRQPPPRQDASDGALVITGMHRSGTSLVASLMQRGGLEIGRRLLGPTPGNRRGHFEDLELFELQDAMLKARGLDILVQDTNALARPTEEETCRARAIIAGRRGTWGFKDPRSVLFLDLWSELLPRARYLFVYRHPIDVALSILRRGTDVTALMDPLICVRSWQAYNASIAKFYRHHRETSCLCHISSVAADPNGFVDSVCAKLDLPPRQREAAGLFHEAELNQKPPPPAAHDLLRAVAPEASDLFAHLEAEADLPSVASPRAADLIGQESLLLESLAQSQELATQPPAPLFHLLLSLLEPDTMAAIPIRLGKTFTELREGITWLEQQRDEWQRSAEQRQAELRRETPSEG